MNSLIISFPRTGSHYLSEYFLQSTGIRIPKTHNINAKGTDNIITLIRDPLETIKSSITMTTYYDGDVDHYGEVQNYNKFFNKIVSKATIIVDYNTLVESPELVCAYIADKIGIDYKEIEYVNKLKDNHLNRYLVTSKRSTRYKSIDFSSLDLEESYRIYKKVLDLKSI